MSLSLALILFWYPTGPGRSASFNTAAVTRGTKPREDVGSHLGESAARGVNTTIRLAAPQQASASYEGRSELRAALEQNLAQPRAVAAADFDEDGMPDLISGFEYRQRGIVTLLRGNIDSIYPNSPQAQQRSSGKSTNSSFLSPGWVFEAPAPADFVGAGDFDGDGHYDVVAASRSGSSLWLLSGDGHGGLSPI